MADDRLTSHDNRDPITNAPGAHPVGTGVGAAGGAVAGAAAGAIAGPIGLADDNEVVDTLNDLIETCCDGQRGFSACAKHTDATDLQAVFQKRARECGDAATELTEQVVRLGGEPTEGGSVSGALHRGWLAARSSLTGHSDASLLDECERGEDHALAAYRKSLKQPLPSDIRSLVQRQANGAQRNHDQIKALRDQAKSRD